MERLSFPRSAPVPGRLYLTVGDEAAIELTGLGTAGYRWREQVCGDPNVVTIRWQTANVSASDQISPGASASETAVIRADSPGQATVVLLLARPWESTVKPFRWIAIIVIVAGPPNAKSALQNRK